MRLAIVLVLLACGDNKDADGQSHDLIDLATEWLTDHDAVHGEVYRCESPAECGDETEEWCWKKDDEAGIELALAAMHMVPFIDCWPITVSERWFPALVGCAYRCDPPLDVPGSNAHCGVLCAPEEE